jgi:hypothetical protein
MQQRYEKFNNLQRKIKAAQTSKCNEDRDLVIYLKRRGENKNYDAIKDNRFRPINLTKTTIEEFRRQ